MRIKPWASMGLYSSPAPPSSMSMDAKSELGEEGREKGFSAVLVRGETYTVIEMEERGLAIVTCTEPLVTLCQSRCSCLCTALSQRRQ
jgi:hypothetical protein